MSRFDLDKPYVPPPSLVPYFAARNKKWRLAEAQREVKRLERELKVARRKLTLLRLQITFKS